MSTCDKLTGTLTLGATMSGGLLVAKGDKGDKGDAYIITEADKQEIKEALSGDISELKSDLTDLTKVDVTWTKGYRLNSGIQVVGNDWYITDYIELSDDILFQLSFTVKNMNTLQTYCTYDKNKNYIKGYKVGSDSLGFVSGITNITDYNAKYIRFCSFDSDGKHSISISNLNGLKLKNEFVKSEYLADKCVTVDKCDFITHDPDTNYINKSKIVDGYYITADGQPKKYTGLAITDFIPVIEETTLYANDVYAKGYCAFYDKDKKCVVGYGNNEITFPITVPLGSVYARFTISSGNISSPNLWIFTKNEKPKDYAEVLKGVSVKQEFEDNTIDGNAIKNSSISYNKVSFVSHDPKSNYIDTTKITNGYYVKANGELNSNSSFAVTDYIEVEPLKTYYGYHLLSGYCAFYDEDKKYVVGYDYNTFPFPITIPECCKYARFSINTEWYPDTSEVWLYTENIKPKEYSIGLTIPTIEEEKEVNPCEYDGDEICVFRKGLCIGDSLTEGVFNYNDNGVKYLTDSTKSYPSKLAMLTGLEIVNKGHGGLTSDEWYATEQNTDLSGFDFCIIQLGVNDSFRHSGWTQTSIDAFTNIINKIKAENNNIKIYVATIMPAKSYSGTNIDEVSQGIRDLVTSLDSNVILLDMAIYAHTNYSDAYNCGHLSELGYYRLAKDYKNYISYHISKNLMQYQQVQFIGTDKVYS